MKPDYNLCDVCGKPTKNRFWAAVDRKADGAGGMEDIGENVDLCGACMACWIESNLLRPGPGRVSDYEAGFKLVEWVKARKKR